MKRAAVLSVVLTALVSHQAQAFGIFGNVGLARGAHWDAALRNAPSGEERSLAGGLRYSVSGGTYESFRDQFSWQASPPTVADFQQAVDDAFDAWTLTDPVTGLHSTLSFTPDLSTSVVDGHQDGSEIDVFAFDFGDSGLRGTSSLSWGNFQNITLTSGATYFAQPINGSDIRMNANANANWTLPLFQTLLTHEIGHSLGLKDVDVVAGPNGDFIDDNFDGTNSTTAEATLTNSFALLIDPLDPSNSPLTFYTVDNADPGFDTAGVNILMESNLPGPLIGDPSPLRNDDYAGRQFLYPVIIPEPSSYVLALTFCVAALLLAQKHRRKSTQPKVAEEGLEPPTRGL